MLPLAVGANTTVAGLKRLIAAEWGLPASDQKLLCKGRALDDAKSLVQNGVSDKDFLGKAGSFKHDAFHYFLCYNRLCLVPFL